MSVLLDQFANMFNCLLDVCHVICDDFRVDCKMYMTKGWAWVEMTNVLKVDCTFACSYVNGKEDDYRLCNHFRLGTGLYSSGLWGVACS